MNFIYLLYLFNYHLFVFIRLWLYDTNNKIGLPFPSILPPLPVGTRSTYGNRRRRSKALHARIVEEIAEEFHER